LKSTVLLLLAFSFNAVADQTVTLLDVLYQAGDVGAQNYVDVEANIYDPITPEEDPFAFYVDIKANAVYWPQSRGSITELNRSFAIRATIPGSGYARMDLDRVYGT
jgi:hypothetical protein